MFGNVSTLGFIFGLVFYLAPTFIALKLDHKDKVKIILVNIFGGLLFGIGWIIALIWCFFNKRN
jgi:uncharacterized membrane protein YedE/YeeE